MDALNTEPTINPDAPTVELPVVASPTKPWYASATIWLNLLTLAVLALEGVTRGQLLDPFFKDPNQLASVNGALLGLLAFANLALRIFKTTSPVSLKG